MSTTIADIVSDDSLDAEQITGRVAELLVSRPDRGVDEAVQALLTATDVSVAVYAANYLALLPDHKPQKRRVVEHVLDERINLLRSVVNLVKDMPRDVVGRLVDVCLVDPESRDTYSVLFEIATNFPARLRKHADRFTREDIRAALLPGAPDSWVEDRVQAYRRDHDPKHLLEISCIRTDKAVEALIKLRPEVPEELQEDVDAYIESSGVFPDTREASVCPTAFRGFVVDRGEGPHEMGGPVPYAVPKCPVCDTPANRILTLVAAELDCPLDGPHQPSFFWYECPHPPGYVVVQIMSDRIKALMHPMSDGQVGTDLVPGNRAMVLEKHPNQSGLGIDQTPGFSCHQTGGFPPWVRIERFPHCPLCQKRMIFLAAIDSGMTPFGKLGFEGILYGFWCDACSVSCTQQQKG